MEQRDDNPETRKHAFIMNLPTEILLHVFKYLPHSDLLAASETCRQWYMAANDRCFREKKCVNLIAVERNNYSALKLFQNSETTYKDFTFRDSMLTSKSNSFWNKKGEEIKSLTFMNCSICLKGFIYLLKCCPNLEELSIHCCGEFNCKSQYIDCCCEEFDIMESYTKDSNLNGLDLLQKLSISTGNPIQYSLDFAVYALSYFSGRYEEIHPQGDIRLLLDDALMFDIILQFVTSRAKTLRKLYFDFCCERFDKILVLPDLKLESLELRWHPRCDIELLPSHQRNLRELIIPCLGSSDDIETTNLLKRICEYFADLQYLFLQSYNTITISELFKLKKLTSLNLSYNNNTLLEKVYCSDYNYILRNLVRECSKTETTLILLSEKLPNLTSLVLNDCTDAVTDVSIQTILKNQVGLRNFLLIGCENISDVGLTSAGIYGTIEELEEAVSKRSRPNVPQSFTTYSLERLKILKELYLSKCNRITDISLTPSFRLVELVKLDITECEQKTQIGIESLVENCPSIEYCKLSSCNN